ncbi:MAG: hypothetical protein Q7W30_08800 [Coriobacteriia bacterium]|nr:hypothetical protein [Coriobacteriia bacterium]
MLGNLLVVLLAAMLIGMGVYSIRHPERPPLGWSIGDVPPPERMRVIGIVLLGAGILVAALATVALVIYYV